MADEHRPKLAIVSTDIRRDLVEPLRHLRRVELTHFYRRASYGDLLPSDLDASLMQYRNPADLLLKLMQSRPDIVQGVEPFSIRLLPYLYSVFVACNKRRVPLFLVTLENRPLDVKHGQAAATVLRALLRPVFARASAIVTLNEGSRHNVLSVGPYDDKICHLMYGTWGVDPSEFCPERNGEEPSFGSGPVLLYVGRLHKEKGVFDLLAAFDRVLAGAPTAKLVMIGNGPEHSRIESLLEEGGHTNDVLLLGTIKNRGLPPYYRAANVFVSPSITTRKWEEQVGMTNIQAMACGLPVVSTRSGAIPEYVSEGVTGLLVREGNTEELANAILQVLGDETMKRRLAQAARAQVMARYDAQRNVLRAEQLVLALIRLQPCA